MNRKKTLEKAFQRGHLLSLKNKFYLDWVKKFIVDETKGDVGDIGDVTSDSVLSKNPVVKAKVYVRERGIVAGVEEVSYFYKNNGISVKVLKKDGSRVKKGDVVLRISGKLKDLLRIERSALDLMQRMSGIASLADSLMGKVKGRIGIAPTRKTQWRYLDKKAVYVGGGLTHRLALWESVLIKDNHLKALRMLDVEDVVESALRNAAKNKKANFIEIEVVNQKDAVRAAKVFKELKLKKPCLIMLDNINPLGIKKIIKELKRLKLYDSVLIEASGGITPEKVVSFSKSGADVVSLGYLTHSVKVLDIKQKIVS
ncbi:MAG: carboxylating nicotinate-nucleotide diphosphorylase [Candidatus Woesearchaeota archaeon]|nr:carboxylating nicotinate-nucleotide diphosphorylase [Candidatus Woesearchaeota archaeon]MDP7323855.1 carboxylating nicotinate-nucleotide diphosphorylase [Candidatus Woesearchaeota archaeon]